ncbi:hypothetical protein [Microtetraspora malaysiensis]|uniref:hypothetical protein n=1 Tax=Microtetraspora malaysiensis TaxID=161358 RepID=UPI003D945311
MGGSGPGDGVGTNLLTVAPGDALFGGNATLPEESAAMIRRIEGTEQVTSVGKLDQISVYRNDKILKGESGGITAYAADLDLLTALKARVAVGNWLNAATARYPTVALGHTAAARLGVTRPSPDTQVLDGHPALRRRGGCRGHCRHRRARRSLARRTGRPPRPHPGLVSHLMRNHVAGRGEGLSRTRQGYQAYRVRPSLPHPPGSRSSRRRA